MLAMERNMVVCAGSRPLDHDELAFRRRALRDAVICIGWLKLVTVICYMFLYFLVLQNCKRSNNISKIILIMLLIMIPFVILNGMLLFLGALEERVWALTAGLWLCLATASYNTVLGVTGALHFIQTGYLTMHFFLAVIFAIMAISIFTIVCHDVFLIHAYRKHLRTLVT